MRTAREAKDGCIEKVHLRVIIGFLSKVVLVKYSYPRFYKKFPCSFAPGFLVF